MINMNCPSCAVHGRVPKALINVRLVCKKCQEPFHMNSEGIAIAGDPPPPPGSDKPVDDAALNDPGLIVDMWIAKIVRVMKLLGTLVVASIAAVGLYALYSNFKPNSLLGRVSEAADVILKDDLPKFNTFAFGDTGIDLFEWYGFMRPKLDDVRRRVPEKEMGFVTKGKKENSEEHTAEIVMRFGAKNELSRREITTDEELTGQVQQYLDVRTYWKADKFGRWWIDGSQTLRGPVSTHETVSKY
jgi:hypothetical protein